jgi:outer membrane receptor protein involved in Fe transport
MTAESDGEETRFTALFGVNSEDGRGNIMLGLENYERDVVWQRDREFYQNGWYEPGTNAGGFILAPGFSFAGPSNRPSQAAVDALWAQYHPGVTPPNVVWGPNGPTNDPTRGGAAVHEIYFNTNGAPFVIPGARGFTGPFTTTAGNQTQDLGDGIWGMRINPNGNLGQVWEGVMASTPQERKSIFGRARYDISDNITAVAQLTFSNNTVKTTQGTISPAITVWQAHVISDGRPLPPALQTLLDSRANPAEDWRLFRGIDLWQEAASVDNSNDVFQLTAGLEGRFANDWTWEAYASTGETDTRNDYYNLPSLQRWRWMNALPLFGAGDATGLPGQPGNSIGQAGVPPVNAGSSAGHHVFAREYILDCTSGLPIFGNFQNMSANCLDSIDSRSKAASTLTQDIYEFNLQGRLADMPAGELRFALGTAYRDNTFRFEPLNDNRVISDHPVGLFVSDNTYGEMTVKELYGELLVPVTQRLDLELGYRYSDFNTAAGEVDTWKALFDYAATESISFRGGVQQATRAPNTAEMFQGPIMLTVGFGPSDPCTFTTTAPWGNVANNPNRLQVQQLCIDLIGNPNTPFGGTPGTPAANTFVRPGVAFFPLENVLERGDPNLIAESADTWTFGVVFSGPGRLENLTAALDVYDISMTDAIARLSPLFVYEQCFNANGTSNPTYTENDPGGYCRLIGRQPVTGERDTVQAPFVNQGALETSGVDLQLNWRADMGGGGSFYINSMVSVLTEYKIQDSPAEPFLEAKGTLAEGGQYDYRMNNTFGYDFGGGRASVGIRWMHLPEVKSDAALRSPTTRVLGVDAYDLFSLFGGYDVTERIQLRGGIDNLLDEQPPVVNRDPGTNPALGCPGSPACNNNSANTNTQFYDILGRRAYIALKMNF